MKKNSVQLIYHVTLSLHTRTVCTTMQNKKSQFNKSSLCWMMCMPYQWQKFTRMIQFQTTG